MKQTTETIWKGAYVPGSGLIGLNLITNKEGNEAATQEDWISLFNDRSEKMLDASDLYRIGKPGTPGELLGSIRKSFDSTWSIVTSTSCLGKANSLYGKIIHNKGSTVVKPTEVQVMIPHYSHASLDQVLRTDQGLTFSRALFDTKDDAETIAEILERLTQYKSKDIVFYTNSQNDRGKHPELNVRFHPTSCSEEYVHGKKWFFIGKFSTASGWYNGGLEGGTSRGIKLHKQ